MDATARRYYRAAQRRLAAAEILLNQEGRSFNLDAVYLAGYTAECSLKALIVEATPREARTAMAADISQGARAHDFEYLMYIYRARCSGTVPRDVRECLTRVRSIWNADIRYDSRQIESADAEAVIEAARAVLEWVEWKLP